MRLRRFALKSIDWPKIPPYRCNSSVSLSAGRPRISALKCVSASTAMMMSENWARCEVNTKRDEEDAGRRAHNPLSYRASNDAMSTFYARFLVMGPPGFG
jgi:hypothetical protein